MQQYCDGPLHRLQHLPAARRNWRHFCSLCIYHEVQGLMPASRPGQPASQPAIKGRRTEEQKRPLASGQESVGKASVVAARWMDWGSLLSSETGAVTTDRYLGYLARGATRDVTRPERDCFPIEQDPIPETGLELIRCCLTRGGKWVGWLAGLGWAGTVCAMQAEVPFDDGAVSPLQLSTGLANPHPGTKRGRARVPA